MKNWLGQSGRRRVYELFSAHFMAVTVRNSDPRTWPVSVKWEICKYLPVSCQLFLRCIFFGVIKFTPRLSNLLPIWMLIQCRRRKTPYIQSWNVHSVQHMPVWACPRLLCVWFCVRSIWLRSCTAAESAFCSSILRDPLTIKEGRITHTNKRHAGPNAMAAGAGLAFTLSQSGKFPWKPQQEVQQSSCPSCALPLPMLI